MIGMLDCVLSGMVCLLFLLAHCYARFCAVCHSLFGLPLCVMGMLNCVLSVICHNLVALPLGPIGMLDCVCLC